MTLPLQSGLVTSIRTTARYIYLSTIKKSIKTFQLLKLLGLVIGILDLECMPSFAQTAKQTAIPEKIDCTVSYRSSNSQGFDKQKISLTSDFRGKELKFDDLNFRATYSGDEFEGWSLIIQVGLAENNKQLHEQLYQLDREQGLRNQFIGPHGFTGLGSIDNPNTTGQIQYLCFVP
jgi:hypothetical protein